MQTISPARGSYPAPPRLMRTASDKCHWKRAKFLPTTIATTQAKPSCPRRKRTIKLSPNTIDTTPRLKKKDNPRMTRRHPLRMSRLCVVAKECSKVTRAKTVMLHQPSATKINPRTTVSRNMHRLSTASLRKLCRLSCRHSLSEEEQSLRESF